MLLKKFNCFLFLYVVCPSDQLRYGKGIYGNFLAYSLIYLWLSYHDLVLCNLLDRVKQLLTVCADWFKYNFCDSKTHFEKFRQFQKV